MRVVRIEEKGSAGGEQENDEGEGAAHVGILAQGHIDTSPFHRYSPISMNAPRKLWWFRRI